MPARSGGLIIDASRAIIPLSLATLALLAFGFHVPWFIVGPLTLVVPLLYIGAAVYAHRELPKFERAFNRLAMQGDAEKMWSLYRDARLLRLAAPAYRMRAKLGLILSLRGDHRRAERVLEEAWERAPKSRRVELLGPLARAKYEVGDVDSLRVLAEQWRQRSLFPGAANVYLAAALLESSDDHERARELIDETEGRLSGEDAELAASLRASLQASG